MKLSLPKEVKFNFSQKSILFISGLAFTSIMLCPPRYNPESGRVYYPTLNSLFRRSYRGTGPVAPVELSARLGGLFLLTLLTLSIEHALGIETSYNSRRAEQPEEGTEQ